MGDLKEVIMEPRAEDSWVLIWKDPDVTEFPWVAHVLRYDLVTTGASVEHAAAMAQEATAMYVEDCLSSGLPSTPSEPLPVDVLQMVESVFARGRRVALPQLPESDRASMLFALPIQVCAGASDAGETGTITDVWASYRAA